MKYDLKFMKSKIGKFTYKKTAKFSEFFIPTVVLTSKRKKEFYKLAEVLVDLNKFRVAPEVRISLELKFYFSGKCNCDIDNLCKTTLDFLQDKGVFKNDKQVKHLDANVLENMLLNGVYTKITTITRKH